MRIFKEARSSMKPTFEEIQNVVLETLNINKGVFLKSNKSRFFPIVRARQIICYICERAGYSMTEIATVIGFNHGTVKYHINTAKDHCLYEREYSTIINKILAKLNIPIVETTLNGYVTRDEDGQLTIFSERPDRDRFNDGQGFWCGECPRELNSSLFPQITWDSEPRECKIVVTLE